MSTRRKNILFLCTGNSCRSQMAEAWAKTIRSEEWQVFSAGTEIHGMNPNVLEVMAESGISMDQHYSKTLEQLGDITFDTVVTVCDHAAQACPTLPSTTAVVHAPFDDPPKLANSQHASNDPLDSYRLVRDQIRQFIESAQL